jgi:hypothetical protein
VTVKELAREHKLAALDVVSYLGAANATAEVSEDDIIKVAMAVEQGELGKGKPEKDIQRDSAETNQPGVLHFVSTVRSHTFTVGNQLVKFEDYKMAVKAGSLMHKVLLKYRKPEIMLVLNAPFKDIRDRVAFRKMLNEAIFTGPYDEPSLDRGLAFLEAWHDAEGRAALSELINSDSGGLHAVVEYTVEQKSYKSILEV